MTFNTLAPSDGLYNYQPNLFAKLLARHLIQPEIDTVLLIGPTMCGKTTMLDELPHTIAERSIVKWDLGKVLEHIFGRKLLDERLLGRVKRIENEVVEHSRLMYQNPVIIKAVSGLNSTLRARETPNAASTICVVTIGPPEGIAGRLMAYTPYTTYHTSTEATIAATLAESFALPKRSEKFAKILYINTFGDEGVEWLSKKIEIKKT
jgi:hypothetical protein